MISRSVALYDIPKTWERASVLEDSFPGIASLFSNSVEHKYTNEIVRKNLLNIHSVNGEIVGSNIFMLIHLQEINWFNGRIATRSDLEDVKKRSPNFLSGNYVDFGIVLAGENVLYSYNKTSAINLVSQLKHRGIEIGNGRFIPVSALTQREDANSGYGLTLGLRDDVSSDVIQEWGEFKWDYTVMDGVVRAYLDRNGCWDSTCSSLVSSSDLGRIVIVRPDVVEPAKF